jgi:hypothetical protein
LWIVTVCCLEEIQKADEQHIETALGQLWFCIPFYQFLFTACDGWYMLCSTVFSAVAVQKSNCLASMINQTVEMIISFASERSKLMSWRFHAFVSTLALSI